jgi:hypothetical protein
MAFVSLSLLNGDGCDDDDADDEEEEEDLRESKYTPRRYTSTAILDVSNNPRMISFVSFFILLLVNVRVKNLQ